jgi:2-hydroxychromene-2-carboxylate isomerase
MAKSFEFVFDVGGPNSYLAHRVLPDFCAQTGAHAIYVPVLLGGLFKATGNMAPMIRYAETPAKRNYELLEFQRFIVKHGLSKFKMNPHFPVNTLLVMRTLTAASRAGNLAVATEAAMAGLWEMGADLGDRGTLISIYEAAGLDGSALVAGAEDSDVKAELAANTDRAVNRGAFGVPTFFVGSEIFWGKERLSQLAEALAGTA